MQDSDTKMEDSFKDGMNWLIADKFARAWGKAVRRNRLRMMLFSGIEFKDFKGMSECNPITVR